MKRVRVSSEMLKRIEDALDLTWNTIADDVLTASGVDTMPLSSIVEITLDADHVRMYGDDEEAADILYSMSYNQMKKIATKALKGY